MLQHIVTDTCKRFGFFFYFGFAFYFSKAFRRCACIPENA